MDGQIVTDPLTWVDLDRQHITRHGQTAVPVSPRTLAVHKPRGVVTTRQDELGRRTVYDLLPPGLPWIFPAGRLDADSEGLLILTTDAALAVRLTEPDQHVPKTYHVTITGRPMPETLQCLRAGIELDDGPTCPAEVRVLRTRGKTTTLEVILTEGRNRQIRRMMRAVGHRVRRLVRVAIGAYQLGDLPAGQTRELNDEGLRKLTLFDFDAG